MNSSKGVAVLISTHTLAGTGFARVSKEIINAISDNYIVHHLAYTCPKDIPLISFENFGTVKKIDTTSEFGFEQIHDEVERISPDIVFVSNDVVVVCQCLNRIIKPSRSYKIYSYLAIEYKFPNESMIKHIYTYSDSVFVTCKRWRDNLVSDVPLLIATSQDDVCDIIEGMESKTKILPYPIPSRILNLRKEKVLKIEDDGDRFKDFCVTNFNRNCMRKQNDITIAAFVKFWYMTGKANDVCMVINCIDDVDHKNINSYEFGKILRKELARCEAEYTPHDEYPTPVCELVKQIKVRNLSYTDSGELRFPSDEEIAWYYNHPRSVGLTTFSGEGFGLTVFEGAACGQPQIYTNACGPGSALEKLAPTHSSTLYPVDVSSRVEILHVLENVGGEFTIGNVDDYANALLSFYKNYPSPESRQSISDAITSSFTFDNFRDVILKEVATSPIKSRLYAIINEFKSYTNLVENIVNEFINGVDTLEISIGEVNLIKSRCHVNELLRSLTDSTLKPLSEDVIKATLKI